MRAMRLFIVGLGLASSLGLVLMADSKNWSDWRLLIAGLIIAVFYVVLVLVPWLVYEQLHRQKEKI